MSEVSQWASLLKTDVASNDYLAITGKKKFQLMSLFPAVAAVGIGVALYAPITNKNQINLKALASGTSVITITSADDTSAITLNLVPADLDLDLCDNSVAGFLKTVDLSAAEGLLGVANGGTGLNTIPKGCLLYSDEIDSIAASSEMNLNGVLPIGNSSTGIPSIGTLTAGSNVTITNGPGTIEIAANLSQLAEELNTAGFGINLNYSAGVSWISGNGTDMGMTVNASGRVFIGDNLPTIPSLSAQLTLGGDASTALALGNPNNYKNQFIVVKSPNDGVAGADLSIIAGTGGTGDQDGGDFYLRAGAGTGAGQSGDVILDAGVANAPIIGGAVKLRIYKAGLAIESLVADKNGNVNVAAGFLAETKTAQNLVGAGAIDIVSSKSHFTDTGANALTLEDGTEGQHKYIMHIAGGGGSGVLTPDNLAGGSNITFNAVGDTVHLMFTNGLWFVVGQNNIVIA